MTCYNIIIICHSGISSNSGRHVNAIASGLVRMNHTVTVCVPSISSDEKKQVIEYALKTVNEICNNHSLECPDLIYCWTPRNLIIDIYNSISTHYSTILPYIVHLEDNEALILRDQARILDFEIVELSLGNELIAVPAHLSHPKRASEFIASATAVTSLTHSLTDFLNDSIPNISFWPGYEADFEIYGYLHSLELKQRLNIDKNHFIVSYTGNVHPSNLDEVRSLYLAIALVNRQGFSVKLIRTGLDFIPTFSEHGNDLLQKNVINLGMVEKNELPSILRSADILVQPGLIDDWNRYRVPSKLPEFFASGRPVLLPRVNLGEKLVHGFNALVMEDGSAECIASNLIEWLPQKNLLNMIGVRGRGFARRHLTWDISVSKINFLIQSLMPD